MDAEIDWVGCIQVVDRSACEKGRKERKEEKGKQAPQAISRENSIDTYLTYVRRVGSGDTRYLIKGDGPKKGNQKRGKEGKEMHT